MSNNYEKFRRIEDVVKARGYECNGMAADRSYGIFYSTSKNIGLRVNTDDETFEFKSIHKFAIQLTTGELGSFFEDDHFKRFERQMEKYTFVLHNYDEKMNRENVNNG